MLLFCHYKVFTCWYVCSNFVNASLKTWKYYVNVKMILKKTIKCTEVMSPHFKCRGWPILSALSNSLLLKTFNNKKMTKHTRECAKHILSSKAEKIFSYVTICVCKFIKLKDNFMVLYSTLLYSNVMFKF